MRTSVLLRAARGALVASAIASAFAAPALASSHREAPFLTSEPRTDGTDLYMFRSYEQGRQDYTTVIANYIPFQDPFGGPNYYPFDEDSLYEIHFDNNGDANEDLTFQFRFNNEIQEQESMIPVGDKQIRIPQITSGPIEGVDSPSLIRRESYTIAVVRGDRRAGERAQVTMGGDGAEFRKPVDNIGEKTFAGGYENYARQHVYDVAIPNCGDGRVFVGQRKEPFYIAVGEVFDLFNLDPLGPESGNSNPLEGKNITSIAMEIPSSCLAAGGDPVVGAWTTASKRQGRLIDPDPATGFDTAAKEGGPWVQISRLGNPLVNEVVIGYADKNRFNASEPVNDAQFLDYVTNPALPELVEKLFPSAQAPNNFPRTDLVTVFLRGIQGVNQPQNVVPSEIMRLNTSVPPTAPNDQSPLGVAGGDNAGYPNGRRPADDVVDISLRVAMGALCGLTGENDSLNVGCAPSDAPAGELALTDGVRKTASDYMNAFPYFNTPIPGNDATTGAANGGQ
jgi:hypothetical protein